MLRLTMAADNGTLAGKRVVVTGASSGIGAAVALACAHAGADIVATWRGNEPGANQLAVQIRQIRRRAVLVQADVALADDLEHLAQAARDALGGADVWINNAGADILTGDLARSSRREKLDRLLEVDLRGTMLASWAAADLIRSTAGSGVIINMSWDGALQGLEGENPELFAAVKGGILSFSRSLARSLAPDIRVNVLGPGWIETAFGAGAPAPFREKVTRRIPLGRWGTPEDVAGAAVFLASDAARYMTGQMLLVNGGEIM
jgi:3-oxoacyl-[acyl-carrier protein] reductase